MPIQLISPDTAEDYIIEMSGDLGDDVEFPNKKFRLSQRIIFNCENLRHLSSFAMQKWSRWMKSQDTRQQFVFRMVPPRTIDIFNMIDGYLPDESIIESFYVPYECESCGHEELLLARRGREFVEALGHNAPKLLLPQEINCPKCKSGMKLGVWEAKFLRFLSHLQLPNDSDEINKVSE